MIFHSDVSYRIIDVRYNIINRCIFTFNLMQWF
nr:MAG TPA: hypothetical protein [Caudoviricetes sp.]